MIYLIGGPPRCGKTTTARRLARSLGISWFSVDMLETILVEYAPEKVKKKLFPCTIMYRKAKLSHDIVYKRRPPEEIIGIYLKQGRSVHGAVEIIIKSFLEKREHIVIEGYQLDPRFVSELKDKYKVRAVFLTRFNLKRILSSGRKDWKTKNLSTLKKMALMLSQFSLYFEREAKKYGLPVFNLEDSSKEIDRVIKFMRKR